MPSCGISLHYFILTFVNQSKKLPTIQFFISVFYVRHVNSYDLPPFVMAVLHINSSTSFPRHGRITSNRHQRSDDDERVLQSLAQVDEARGLAAEIMSRIKTRTAPRNRNKHMYYAGLDYTSCNFFVL